MVRISDKELLEILKENCRMPYTQIAKKLKVTEAAIRKKVGKLKEKGIITCYTIELDNKKLGKKINALIGLDAKPEKLMDIIKNLKKRKEINRLYSATGDHMILTEIDFEGMDEMYDYVKKLEKTKGITKVCPAIILERLK